MGVSNAFAFMALLAAPAAADAVIIVVYTEPMSLEQRAVVLGSSGPDRLIHCSTPPAVRQCREVPIKRKR
ncbi:hypothetical protein [uncultured Sphingomonas sp.]|uniref:hypothetical protein n=1 Tax=uncultured Sphingomonas sp. TaxID=158754 RepID=UPI0025EC7FA4|nr:hypothetical protein [uncultured Sphingomonas sp.]